MGPRAAEGSKLWQEMNDAIILKQALWAGLAQWKITVDDRMLQKFCLYYELLRDWNKRINLTAIIAPEEVAVKHFLDSLSILTMLSPPDGLKMVDIGSGAGFPGLPLKIVRPDMEITLVESVGKKVLFLREVVNRLNLNGVVIYAGRAEEGAREPALRGAFQLAAARAVAALPVLTEYALPFLQKGGLFLALKGPKVEGEVAACARALELLGGKIRDIKSFVLPVIPEERTMVIMEKVAGTPEKYPRRPGIPARRPLQEKGCGHTARH